MSILSGKSSLEGGSVATFFDEEGMYIFGKQSNKRLIRYGIYAVTAIAAAILTASAAGLGQQIIGILVLIELIAGIGAMMYELFKFDKENSKVKYPSNAKLEGLLDRNEFCEFFKWSQVGISGTQKEFCFLLEWLWDC